MYEIVDPYTHPRAYVIVPSARFANAIVCFLNWTQRRKVRPHTFDYVKYGEGW